jgi:3-hydroxypropanoate dehydrogenase
MQELSTGSLSQLFLDARTLSAWTKEPVSDELIHRVYELAKLGPTATNSHPTRFFFVRSPEAKERLKAALNPGNVDKTMAAPVTVVIATDPKFHEKMTTLFPARPQLVAGLGSMPAEKRDHMTNQAGGLEAAYFMLAARALGLDCGPMGGFDRAKVDATLLEVTGWKSQLLINVGYGDRTALHPRLPRLDFDVACRVA